MILVNGCRIAQQSIASVTYWHVKVDLPAVLLTEGLPVAFCLETSERAPLISALVTALARDFATRVWEAQARKPLRVTGWAVAAVGLGLQASGALLVSRSRPNKPVAIGHGARLCGRYNSLSPVEALASIIGVTYTLPNLLSCWNVAPTQQRSVIRRHTDIGERHVDLVFSGLVPHFAKDLKAAHNPISAWTQTVASSGTSRGVQTQRRCVVPGNDF
jgi:hypothetical protein